MKTIRINTTIDSRFSNFDELKEHVGKKAEIIVLIDQDTPETVQNSVAGRLSSFANPSKISLEDKILNEVFNEKHRNS